ncbi:MAG: EAL domain-containing protein, partial [Pseudomonadota bacterium]
RLSLDDFGTGYSSLSQLNNFPFDQVKIDGVFVSDLEDRESSRTLIEAILSMAQALNLDTVAEHVGNEYQAAFLRDRGCRKFQGYHFHEPMGELALHEVVKARGKQGNLPTAIGS